MPPAYQLTDRKNALNRRSTQECLNILTADDFDIFSGRSGRLAYDGLTVSFAVGLVVTGAGSGNSATIYAIVETDAVSGFLLVNEATGVFQNNDALTDTGTGVGVAVGTLGPHTGLWTGFTVAEATVFAALTTGYEAKRNVLAAHSFPAGVSIVADLRSIQLTSGVIMAHKINSS